MMGKHNPFPPNCLPYPDNAKNSEHLKKLLDISQSIAEIVSRDAK
jgi:hypothetical protein